MILAFRLIFGLEKSVYFPLYLEEVERRFNLRNENLIILLSIPVINENAL
jgi:hypothetical protein